MNLFRFRRRRGGPDGPAVPLEDERSSRRPEFAGGRPIRLPDGDAWAFFEPRPVVRAVEGPDGSPARVPSWTFGEDLDPTLDLALAGRFAALVGLHRAAATDEERAAVTLQAAGFLLARNYQISPERFAQILAGADRLPGSEQAALGDALRALISDACSRSLAHAEVP